MADTNFVSGTVIASTWLNDINDTVYSALGTGGVAPTTPATVRTNLGLPASSGSTLIGTINTATGGVARTQAAKNADTVSVNDFGVVGGGADDTAKIQAALNTNAKIVDFLGIALKCDAITVPAGVWAKNVNLTKFTNAAGNVVLVNTGSKVTGKIAGTGLTNAVQRCIYPAADGVTDVYLDVDVSAATYGVHAQYLTTDTDANRPKRWTGYVYAHDIVGAVGVSEGYGVILSPANACQCIINSKTIARHALYLSAGARDNNMTVTVDGCQNYAVQLFSTAIQSPTQYNRVEIFAKNLSENVAGQGGAVAIVQNTDYNTVIVNHEGNNATTFSINIEGSSGGPYPLANKVIDGNITGQFIGQDVIRLQNADGTHVRGNTLHCYATVDVIGMRRAGTNGSVHGGYVEGNEINAQGQAIKGVYDELNTQPSYVGPNEITNNSTALRVDDQTSGNRYGFSRRVSFSGTTASIGATSVGDTAPTLSRAVQIAGRRRTTQITGASVTLTTNSNVTAYLTPASETVDNFRIFNAHSAGQTFTYEGWVEGD